MKQCDHCQPLLTSTSCENPSCSNFSGTDEDRFEQIFRGRGWNNHDGIVAAFRELAEIYAGMNRYQRERALTNLNAAYKDVILPSIM